jgi:prolyl-tRNA synthetase
MDLVGIPHRIVVSERGIDAGTLEYRNRRTGETRDVPLEDIADFLASVVIRHG